MKVQENPNSEEFEFDIRVRKLWNVILDALEFSENENADSHNLWIEIESNDLNIETICR